MIVCRDVEASDGVSIRTLVESCIRVKRFPQADVGLNPKENAVAELWIQSSAFFRGNVEMCLLVKAAREWERLIAQFNAQKVRGNSQIDADFIIKNERSGETYFVFIDEKDEHQHYCKSAFAKENVDYMENQSMLTVLKKEKIENGETVVLYRHPNFKEE